MFSFFKKKKIVAHIKLNGVIGNAGKFKQGIDFSGQEEIINTILDKKNILAVMPTGAGKSLCYQLPAIINEKKTIVISPLVALMDDQVSALKQNKVSAERLHSHMADTENKEIWDSFCNGNIKILYRKYLFITCVPINDYIFFELT